jgi:hypothetical protein
MRGTVNAAPLASARQLHYVSTFHSWLASCDSQRRAALPGQQYAVDELRDNVGHDGNNAAWQPCCPLSVGFVRDS